MRDPLKECIDQHRAKLDVAVPSEKLWTNIETAMIATIPAVGVTSAIPWLKYFVFGLSSVAGAGIVYTVLSSSSPQAEEMNTTPATANTVVVSEPKTTPAAQIPAAEFTPMNTAAPLVPQNDASPAIVGNAPPQQQDSLPQTTERVGVAATVNANDSVFTGIKRVEIISSAVTVTVNGTSGNEMSTSRRNVEGANLTVDYKRTDTLLQITLRTECRENKKGRRDRKVCVNFNVGNTSSPEFTANVPTGTSVIVQNTYGDTRVNDVTGAVCEVRTSSGDVKLASVNALTNVVSSYGDLHASNINGNLTARLSSGSAVVNSVKGNVEVVSTYGDQHLTDITGNLKANGSSGNISVTNLRGDISANTTYGDINVTDFKGSARLVSSSGSIVGVNVELTANSTFATTYGDVNMTLVNPLEALSFELVSTHGDITVDKNGEQFHEENRLNLKRGNILIKSTSSSGDQVFR